MPIQAGLMGAGQRANLPGALAFLPADVEVPEFEIALESGPAGARVSVSGELDLATADELRRTLAREMTRGRAVILDLSRVSFLDSTGLTVILRAMRCAQENGWNLGLAAALSEAVVRTTRVAGVLPMLPLVDED